MPPRFISSPSTFIVEEVPAYLPSGEGEHVFLWVEKRDLTTPEAIRRLARMLRVQERDVGHAGMKDRHATTRQWLSIPRVDPTVALTLADDQLRVLDAKRHGNKLRIGHLRGNRFEVVLEDVSDEEAHRIEAQLATMAADGLPNRYGAQRFGAEGDNPELGLRVLRGEVRPPDGRKRRFLLSALQSAVFNRTLEMRREAGLLRRVLVGDVLQKTDTGGVFISTEPTVDQARVDAGAVAITGPMPGDKAVEPPEGSEARVLEDRALAEVGLERSDLPRVRREMPGTRRPLLVRLELGSPPTSREADGALRLRFTLPSGAYATVVVGELLGLAGPERAAPDEAGPAGAAD